MSGLSLDAAKDAKQDAQDDGLRENQAGIPDDLAYDYESDEAPVVKGHPECLITFDYIAAFSVFNTPEDFLDNRQNLEHGGQQGYGNDVVVTVKNPELVEGELWEEDNDFRDYRVLGDPKSDVSPYERREEVEYEDGEPVGANVKGVDLGMGKFDGEPVDGGFDSEYVQFFISSSRATQVLGVLDTAGKWAYDTDGNFTEGIIEAPPNMGDEDYDSSADADGAPRAIGYPELRSDMVPDLSPTDQQSSESSEKTRNVGQRGAIAWTFDDDEPTTQSPVSVDLFKVVDDDDLTALTPLSPGDDAYAKPTYPRAGNLYWGGSSSGTGADSAEGTSASSARSQANSADAEPETDDGVAEAQAMMSDDTEGDDTVTYDDLTEDGQDFVDNAVEAVETAGFDSVDGFEDPSFGERVEQAGGPEELGADADSLARIVEVGL